MLRRRLLLLSRRHIPKNSSYERFHMYTLGRHSLTNLFFYRLNPDSRIAEYKRIANAI